MLSSVYNSILNYINQFTSGKNWLVKTTITLVVLSMVFQFPNYNYFVNALRGKEINYLWQNVAQQKEHLLTYQQQLAGTHMEKTTFRLTVPVLAKILHLNFLGVYLLQFLLGILLIYCTLNYCYKVSGSKADAVLFAAGLIFIYPGCCAFVDVWGQFDAFGYVFIFLAIYFSSPLLIFSFILLASFSDERALIVSSFVFLFYLTNLHQPIEARTKKFQVNKQVIAVASGWCVYFIIRFLLSNFLGFKTGTGRIGLSIFFLELDQLEWGLWSGFEGAWILIITFFVVLLVKKYYRQAFLYFSCLAITWLVAALVTDATRSMAYGFIILYVAFVFLKDYLKKEELTLLLFICFLVSFIHPMYYTLGQGQLYPVHSIFIRILQMLKFLVVKTH